MNPFTQGEPQRSSCVVMGIQHGLLGLPFSSILSLRFVTRRGHADGTRLNELLLPSCRVVSCRVV